MRPEDRLSALGLHLPEPVRPVANYTPCARAGNLLFVSGQLPIGANGRIAPEHSGKLGREVNEDDGREAARICALNILSQVKAELGGLDGVERCVRLGGFLNCEPDFAALAPVMNGASDLMVAVFGDAGRHARSTIGVAQLPLGAVVEVEALFLVK